MARTHIAVTRPDGTAGELAVDENGNLAVALFSSDGNPIDEVGGGAGGTVELGPTSLAALESITATGPLTDAQLRATAVPVNVPADPFGANADAAVAAGASGSIQAKLRRLSADLDVIKTAAEIMDDWDESDRAKVNPIAGQAGVAGGSGAVGATTQRVVLANDVALPPGTNAIGKLAANSGVDIGDVDVKSTPIDTGQDIVAATQHDTNNDPAGPFRGFMLSAEGALKIRTLAGQDRTFAAGVFAAKTIYSVGVLRVFDTGTDAITVYGIV